MQLMPSEPWNQPEDPEFTGPCEGGCGRTVDIWWGDESSDRGFCSECSAELAAELIQLEAERVADLEAGLISDLTAIGFDVFVEVR